MVFLFSVLPTNAQTLQTLRCCINKNTGSCRLGSTGEPVCNNQYKTRDIYQYCTGEHGAHAVEHVCVNNRGDERDPILCTDDVGACASVIGSLTDCTLFINNADCLSHDTTCFFYNNTCYSRTDTTLCPQITDANYCGAGGNRGSKVCIWGTNKCQSPSSAGLSSQFGGKAGLLTACARQGNCRDINDLIEALFPIAQKAFALIGAVAFAMFIYGGFTIILSFGNSERVGEGKKILVAAVIGIIISFSAYLLIKFLLDALGVTGVFKSL